jgi:hypothetical protein
MASDAWDSAMDGGRQRKGGSEDAVMVLMDLIGRKLRPQREHGICKFSLPMLVGIVVCDRRILQKGLAVRRTL